MTVTLRRLIQILREPVLDETRRNLARSWARLPERFRSRQQMLGRGGNGCGATIGAMPRCDFACVGCYLNDGANQIPAQPVHEIKAQIDVLRPTLGDAGNLQLTDGEVTLRPADEVIELLRYATSQRLIPMLMTHGDTFRRRPGLLDRLMTEGGLVELSLHVDTTQRGRLGGDYKHATTEAALNPLRAEFADLVRGAKARTGRELRVATTMTVTADNVSGVPDVLEWLLQSNDAVRLISFQPIAQVGRTVDGLGGGCSVEALWEQIALGVFGPSATREEIEAMQLWVGHPDCNRYLPGVVVSEAGKRPRFFPMRREGDETDMAIVDGFLARFGGISFRMDTPVESTVRKLAVLLHQPGWVLRTLPRAIMHWLRKFDAEHPWRFALQVLRGQVKVGGLVLISHHFMSEGMGQTPEGRERLDLCVFHVPIDGTLVPMCEVNTTSIRRDYYERIKHKKQLAVLQS